MSFEAHVHPHGDITEVIPAVFEVTGSLPHIPLPRNMAIVPIDGGLLLHSVVALNPEGMAALEALGTPRIMIVPSGLHRADASVYKERYPDLQVVAPRACIPKVEQVLPVDAAAEDVLPELGIGVIAPPGCKPKELVYEVGPPDQRALILCDLLFNIREHLTGVQGLILRYLTRSTGFFGMTTAARWMMLQDRQALKRWLQSQAEREDLRAILVGHGDPVLDCSAALTAAAERL